MGEWGGGWEGESWGSQPWGGSWDDGPSGYYLRSLWCLGMAPAPGKGPSIPVSPPVPTSNRYRALDESIVVPTEQLVKKTKRAIKKTKTNKLKLSMLQVRARSSHRRQRCLGARGRAGKTNSPSGNPNYITRV